MGDQPDTIPLPTHRTVQTQKNRTDIHASSEIRTHDPKFERLETVHALYRTVTMIGHQTAYFIYFLLRGLSTRENYIHRATAACRRVSAHF
jgi:hypothetical protein